MSGCAYDQCLVRTCLLIFLLASGSASAQQTATVRWTGQPLGAVLNSLRSVEFAVVFTSELVRSDFRVRAEPVARDPQAMAREILIPFSLALRAVAPGVFAVVVLETKPEARTLQTAAIDGSAAGLPLAEVIVSASQYRLTSAVNGAVRLDAAQLDAQPKMADDPMRAVARLPGIANNGLSARLNVRGGDVDEVRLLLDGFPIRQAFHLPGFQNLFSIVDASLIGKMDVYTGGFPARYGDRMSGIIAAESLPSVSSPRRSLGLSTFHATLRTAGVLSAERRLDGLLGARVGVVRSWLDQLGPENREPNYADSLGRLRWQLSDSASLSAQYLWSRDRLAVSDPDRGEAAELVSNSRYLWLRGDTLLGERWRASAWLGSTVSNSSRSGTLRNPGIAQGDVSDERSADLWDLKLALFRDFGERRHLEIGADWQVGDGDYTYRSTVQFPAAIAAAYGVAQNTVRNDSLAPFRRDFALYGMYRFRTSETLTSELGLRVQKAAGLGLRSQVVFDPRVSIDKSVSERTHLRLSWGRFHQLDEVQELRVEDGVRGFSGPQHSDQLIVGIEHVAASKVVWRAEAYQKTQADPRPRFENPLNPLAILAELAPDRMLVQPSSAKIRGIEWSAARNARPWSWRLAYSWSQAFDELAGDEVPRAWDQPHAINASIEWQRRRWSASAALSVHSGWPTTVLTTDGTGAFSPGARNAERWPWFSSLDLHVSYRRPLAVGELVFTLDVANALDRRNRCCAELVTTRGNGAVPGLEPLTWIQRVPTLAVRWDF